MTEILKMAEARVEWRRVDGEVVVLDLAEQRYLGINRAGAILWPMLDRGATRDRLVAALVEAYGIGPDVAGHDVDAFVADLDRRGVLARTEGG